MPPGAEGVGQVTFALELQIAEPVEWRLAYKGHPKLLALADRHYTRQKRGSSQFCRPGINLSLLLSNGLAGWNVWRPIPSVGRMDDLEAWECTLFRNEDAESVSSALIMSATERTFREWGWPPKDGLITAVGVKETRARRSKSAPPGVCFVRAGWVQYAATETRVWLRAPHPQKTRRT